MTLIHRECLLETCHNRVKKANRSYCSIKCSSESHRRHVWHLCENKTCSTKTPNPRFCSISCSATVTNSESPRRPRLAGWTPSGTCHREGCENPARRQLCSPRCGNLVAQAIKKVERLAAWISGDYVKRTPKAAIWMKRYILDKAGWKCELCGWDTPNPWLVPPRPILCVDHIDGNPWNSVVSNLRAICGNCDSLQPTYRGLNGASARKRRGALPERGLTESH